MEYHLTKTYITGQRRLVEIRGADLWETLCTAMPEAGLFRAHDVAAVFIRVYGCRPTTARGWAYVICHNCVAMPEGGLVQPGVRGVYRFWGPADG